MRLPSSAFAQGGLVCIMHFCGIKAIEGHSAPSSDLEYVVFARLCLVRWNVGSLMVGWVVGNWPPDLFI